MITSDVNLSRFDQDGYAILRDAVTPGLLGSLRDQTELLRIPTGLRFAISQLTSAKSAAMGPMLDVARAVIGPGARVTRSILFDKTAASNWLVPWHQDVTIAVQARHEMTGFGPWSVKEGSPHVQPPAGVLESMITLRLHLDDTPAGNGALRVAPGSHRFGFIEPSDIPAHPSRCHEYICEVKAGDVVLMRPLLLHASSKSANPDRRRVLHVEYAASDLPAPLQWAE
jgi:ectoine hydroxylase-related dioxygenase (phytanoyl-CoA dioxygenase family)